MRVPIGMRAFLVVALVASITLAPRGGHTDVAAAAECTPTLGPSIPPPASVPSGIPGVHAYWYGQSGYPTLCPGQTSVATVAFYNSGSVGWLVGCCYGYSTFSMISLGTSGPIPGQDQASILGGDSTHGSPHTRWSSYNRPAVQPAGWIGPNQVAWFQFTVKAPPTPGTYRLYLRPLVESIGWLEDFGVFWQVTVVSTTSTPQRVTIESVDKAADVFVAGGTRFLYDANDGFEYGDATLTLDEFESVLSPGDVIDVRYEASAAARSSYNVVDDPPYGAPTVTARVGSFDGGATSNDIRVDLAPPQNGRPSTDYVLQRAAVPPGTSACTALSGSYMYVAQYEPFPIVDRDLASGTYCYRGVTPSVANVGIFGYSAPATIADPPAPADPPPPPRSIDARTTPSTQGDPRTFDLSDQLTIVFDAAMAPCGSAVLRLRDADGTVAELDAASRNISCAVNSGYQAVGGVSYPPGRVVTIGIAAPPTIVAAGTAAGLQVPATAVSASGITSSFGAAWDLADSLDIVFGDPD